ncbi:unnamed protein product [Peronospora destructor]|uniref:Sugar phosphate transporter domain-containing protein n=1 Tax=Peronospora destructor TaxID=86335 RepID=A0AAV0SY05_9STRA|nr:unnamed protein product [Peronospora destructor]
MNPRTLSTRPPRIQSSGTGLIKAGHVSFNVHSETDEDDSETIQLLDEMDNNNGDNIIVNITKAEAADNLELQKPVNTSYVTPSIVIFWLTMWFFQNISVTFWNKKALSTLQLPVTLTFVHMMCNALGAFLYIYMYKGIDRKELKPRQKQLMVYFSVIFVSNIITGNWSLGLVSVSLNQVMRALVPAVVIVLSMLILGKRTRLRVNCRSSQ